MSTSVISGTGEVSISDMCQAGHINTFLNAYISSRYISFLDVPDQKSTICQADNTPE